MMLLRQKYKHNSLLSLTILFVSVFVFFYSGQTFARSTNPVSSTPFHTKGNSFLSVPNSSVELDFSVKTAESWDSQGDSNNVRAHCISGKTITGFEFTDIVMQTVGSSFFSEAVFYFSDSSEGVDDGIKFRIGAGNESSGSTVFNSNGIFDITDSGNSDVNSLFDDKFMLQIFEDIDDEPNAIDSRFTSGKLIIWGVDLVAAEGCPFIASSTNQPTDLALNYTTQAINHQIGDSIDINLSVVNEGGEAATNVKFLNTLSNNLDFIELSCDDGSNTMDISDIASFDVQNIAAQSTLECILKTVVNADGEVSINVLVTANSELNVSNNNIDFILGSLPAVAVPINSPLTLLIFFLLLIVMTRKSKLII